MNAPGHADRAMSLLGMARRARELVIGQDRVFAAMKNGCRLFIVTSEDCSSNVLRKIRSSNCDMLVARGHSRESLGSAVGVANAQIVALPLGSGFVKKLKELLKSGGR
jgi:ribosomal protein L7Ae-like RNA K-turn-binding protein